MISVQYPCIIHIFIHRYTGHTLGDTKTYGNVLVVKVSIMMYIYIMEKLIFYSFNYSRTCANRISRAQHKMFSLACLDRILIYKGLFIIYFNMNGTKNPIQLLENYSMSRGPVYTGWTVFIYILYNNKLSIYCILCTNRR